jgi:hypothetical protein
VVGRFAVATLGAALFTAALSPTFGYSADVRERMMVRNLASVRLDDSVRPVVARDVAAGAGIFEYSEGPAGYGWPLVSAGPDSLPFNIAMLDSGGHLLSRSRIPNWPVWDSVVDVGGTGNQPMFETHNIASSPDSNKVCIAWVCTDTSPMPGYYRVSSDGGASWDSVKQLEWPSAYGADTVTSFHVSSLYPFYDEYARLNIVAAVHPVVNDTSFIMPAGIWHWCPDNNPNWKLIHRAGCAPEHLAAPVGSNALYACRPSGCGTADGHLLVAWEQFDSSNVDPQTNLLRAGICVGYENFDTLLAADHACSYRFPAIATHPSDFDSTFVLYVADQVAGFAPLGQGPCTNNPVLCRQLYFGMDNHLGKLDTIGGTTYDLQSCGPARTLIHDAPGYGVHAAWMYSGDTTGAFPDLNMRYNFYDNSFDDWNWLDRDFMNSGVNVFPYMAGLGSMDVEPATGIAVVSACTPPPPPYVTVEESRRSQAPSSKPVATIVRCLLFLPRSLDPSIPRSLLDISGRRVLDLKPGANDVSRLSPGVYFVREEPPTTSLEPRVIQKVLVVR